MTPRQIWTQTSQQQQPKSIWVTCPPRWATPVIHKLRNFSDVWSHLFISCIVNFSYRQEKKLKLCNVLLIATLLLSSGVKNDPRTTGGLKLYLSSSVPGVLLTYTAATSQVTCEPRWRGSCWADMLDIPQTRSSSLSSLWKFSDLQPEHRWGWSSMSEVRGPAGEGSFQRKPRWVWV